MPNMLDKYVVYVTQNVLGNTVILIKNIKILIVYMTYALPIHVLVLFALQNDHAYLIGGAP